MWLVWRRFGPEFKPTAAPFQPNSCLLLCLYAFQFPIQSSMPHQRALIAGREDNLRGLGGGSLRTRISVTQTFKPTGNQTDKLRKKPVTQTNQSKFEQPPFHKGGWRNARSALNPPALSPLATGAGACEIIFKFVSEF